MKGQSAEVKLCDVRMRRTDSIESLNPAEPILGVTENVGPENDGPENDSWLIRNFRQTITSKHSANELGTEELPGYDADSESEYASYRGRPQAKPNLSVKFTLIHSLTHSHTDTKLYMLVQIDPPTSHRYF